MLDLISILNNYLVYIVLGLVITVILMFILLILNRLKLKKIQKKYQVFMMKEDLDLETMLIEYAKKVNKVENDYEVLTHEVNQIQISMKECVQKIGVIRYNAIEKVGADLSFAIAMLDENNNGFVLNGIYSRDGSYTYAKPIKNLQSKYTLSDEEKQAIQQAITK